MKTPQQLIRISLLSCSLFSSTIALADVKYRIDYNHDNKEYTVFMTPDSVPTIDMVLTGQVTISVPHDKTDPFTLSEVNSIIKGLSWVKSSQVDAPVENASRDYLSFSMYLTASTPPKFGWEANKELAVFNFTSPKGCVDNVALLENDDPFNNLPNSVSTNPGNAFSNLGWPSANNYTGNYGTVVKCSSNSTDENNTSSNPVEPAVLTRQEFLEEAIIYAKGELDLVKKRIQDLTHDLPRAEGKLTTQVKRKLNYSYNLERKIEIDVGNLQGQLDYLNEYTEKLTQQLNETNTKIQQLDTYLGQVFSGSEKSTIESQLDKLNTKRTNLMDRLRIMSKSAAMTADLEE